MSFDLLAYPEVGWSEVRAIWPELSAVEPAIAIHVEIDAKYDVYLKRQTADVDAFRRDEGLLLGDIDYALVPGLSNEVRAKLHDGLVGRDFDQVELRVDAVVFAGRQCGIGIDHQ